VTSGPAGIGSAAATAAAAAAAAAASGGALHDTPMHKGQPRPPQHDPLSPPHRPPAPMVALDMSLDQTAFRADECARVRAAGATVRTLQQLLGTKVSRLSA
jgi:hypothetical protein